MQAISERANNSRVMDVWEGPYSFFLGRGSGASILFAIATDGTATRFMNCLYLFGLFLLFLRLCIFMMPGDGFFGKTGPFPLTLPIAVAIFLISYFTGFVEFQKFRLQDFFWVCAIFVLLVTRPFEVEERAHLYNRLLMISCIALTLATPYAMYFVAFSFLFAIAREIRTGKIDNTLFAMKVGAISTCVLLGSWWYNYTVAGMFDFAPLQFFFPRRNPEIYDLWFSPDVGSMMSFTVEDAPTNYKVLYWTPLPFCLIAIATNFVTQYFYHRPSGPGLQPHVLRMAWILLGAGVLYASMVLLITLLHGGPSLDRVLGVCWFFHFIIVFAGLISAFDVVRYSAHSMMVKMRSVS
jgi:hypothetical protein